MTIASITFTTVASAGSFELVRLTGQEAISAPFRFDVSLVSSRRDLDANTLIGQPATLTIRSQRIGEAEVVVPYYGIITSFDQGQMVGSGDAARVYYRARLEPQLAKLARSPTSAVFVDPQADSPTQTVKSVVQKVLDRAKTTMPSLAYEFRQIDETTLRKRDFICQFEESDLAFISRLLESEGLFFFIEHGSETKDKLVVAGQRTVHTNAPRARVRLRTNVGIGMDDDILASFTGRRKMLPHKVVLRGYSPDSAARGTLKAEAVIDSTGVGEVMLHGEDFRSDTEGTQLAKVRAEELACRGKTFVAEGSATGLRAGYLIEIAEHFNTTLNGKRYLITDISHEATQNVSGLAALDPQAPGASTYRSGFTAILFTDAFDGRDVQFRPERLTSKPRIHGTLSAFVDDDTSGQYASVDPKGRYKVVLPFADYSRTSITADAADARSYKGKGSAWIRMATPYSGRYPGTGASGETGYTGPHGIHFPLHKKTEVLLSFIDGDPDRPIIVGTVPNSENENVVTSANQKESVIMTSGGNRILTQDTKGSESLTISTPYKNAYLRIGKKYEGVNGRGGEDDDIASGGGQISDAGKVGMVMYTKGDGVQYFTGAFISITGVEETTPTFGQCAWEIEHGWDQDTAKLPGSDTELNLKNNITHTHADNIERTYGNSYSTTIGNTEEETKGNTISKTWGNTEEETRGNSSSKTWGNAHEETYGNSDSLVRGNSVENVWGNATSMHMGATQELFLGNATTIQLSAQEEITAGLSGTFNLAATAEIFIGAKFEFTAAASLEMSAGPKTELESAGGLKFKPAFDAEVATNDIKTKVNEIATRTNLIQSNVNKIISTPVMVDTGAMHIQSKGLTLLT